MLNFFRVTVFSLVAFFNGLLIYLLAYAFVDHQPKAVLITVLAVGALLAFSFSPAGEAVCRAFLRVRKLFPNEEARLLPLFREVCERAGENPEEYQLFISPDASANAAALGRHTVILTRGLLHVADDEEIKAVMAHEVAHLKHRDSQILQAASLLNSVGSAVVWVYTVIAVAMGFLASLFGALAPGDPDYEYGYAFEGAGQGFLMVAFAWLIRGLAWICYKILQLSFLAVGRGQEYRCDAFAAQLGYGTALARFLDKSWQEAGYYKPGFFTTLMSTHPDPGARISRLMQAGPGSLGQG